MREKLEQGIKDKNWGSVGAEDCYLVRDMKAYCSHVIVILGETVGLSYTLCFQTWSSVGSEMSKLAVSKQKRSTSYWNPPSLPTFFLEKRKRTSSSWHPYQQGEPVTAKLSIVCFSLLHAEVLCVFTVQLTWCRDCASHKKHDAHAVWDIVAPLPNIRKQKESLEWWLL